jgi:hypothetical protein
VHCCANTANQSRYETPCGRACGDSLRTINPRPPSITCAAAADCENPRSRHHALAAMVSSSAPRPDYLRLHPRLALVFRGAPAHEPLSVTTEPCRGVAEGRELKFSCNFGLQLANPQVNLRFARRSDPSAARRRGGPPGPCAGTGRASSAPQQPRQLSGGTMDPQLSAVGGLYLTRSGHRLRGRLALQHSHAMRIEN